MTELAPLAHKLHEIEIKLWNAEVYLARAKVEEEGRWITVRGTPVFIEKGKDVGEAIREKFKDYKEDEKYEEEPEDPETPEDILRTVKAKYPDSDEKYLKQQMARTTELRGRHESVGQRLRESIEEDLPDLKVSHRIKTAYKIMEKVGRKGKKTVDEINDISGVKAVTEGGIFHLKQAISKIKESGKYDIIQEEDYISKPNKGYRSYHFLIRDKKTGLVSELQLRTENMERWSTYAHERIYKMPDKVKDKLGDEMNELYEYAGAMSEFFAEIDAGNEKAKMPECPKVVSRVIGCLD